MTLSTRVRLAPLLALLVAALCATSLVQAAPPGAPSAAAAEPAGTVNVLYLFEDDVQPGRQELTLHFQARLRDRWPGKVMIDTESTDLSWVEDAEYRRAMHAALLAKHRRRRPDVLVPVSVAQLRLALDLRTTLWPEIPIVFAAESEQSISEIALEGEVTGRFVRFENRSTLELARRLLPDARRVAIVVGESPADKLIAGDLEEALRELPAGFEVIDLRGLALAEIEARARALPEDAFLFQVSMLRDVTGQATINVDVGRRLRAASPRPIFSLNRPMLGQGILGGVMLDWGILGDELAELTGRVLGGERASSIPVGPFHATRLDVDARELARFQIPRSRLPAGAVIHFDQPTLWQQYRGYVVGSIAVTGAQAALIAGLLVERRRRRRAQEALAERVRLEALLAETSEQFAMLVGDEIDGAIVEALRCFGEALGVTRGAVWRLSDDGAAAVQAHGWHAPGTDPPPERLTAEEFPASFARILRGEVLRFSEPGGIPSSSRNAGEPFDRLKAHTLIALPIAAGGSTGTVLTFSDARPRRWPDEVVHILRGLGEILARAMQRRASEAQVRRAEREARKALADLAHINRVAEMSELTASIAHEINQPLAAILANASAARRMLGKQPLDVDELRATLEDIIADDRRAGEVIRRMRALLKKGEVQRSTHDISEIAREVVRLVSNDAQLRDARIELCPAPEPLLVVGDGVQLQQVVLNLVVNALDAVAGQPPERRLVRVCTGAADGKVELRVEDSGKGFAEGEIERIFDAFFTTKKEGMGMGLSISRSIVESHGGQLLAASRAGGGGGGGGAVMRCLLPAVGDERP